MNIVRKLFVLFLLIASGAAFAEPPLEGTHIQRHGDLPHRQGFVSRDDSVTLLLNALGSQLKQPVVVSAKAQKRKVSGSFDLDQPAKAIGRLSGELGLIWYSDGQSLYVYDASEIRNAIGHMRHASISSLEDFLRKAKLIDPRYPVRGGSADGTFYLSGPPVYVDIVLNAAVYLDELYYGADASTQHVEVIKLEHSFVNGRRYGLRGKESVLPGVADILQMALGKANIANVVMRQPSSEVMDILDSNSAQTPGAVGQVNSRAQSLNASSSSGGMTHGGTARNEASSVTVVLPYPETNSLLVRGTLSQIQKVKNLVAEIDIPRKQIEMSLWIIDLKKSELDKLGATWSGEVGIGNKLGVSFNEGGVSTLDGSRFLASVAALSQSGSATIVSRPVLLTQENVMAHFDSNHTFYKPLLAERTASLESVTYGTLISVLPRISSRSEIEMQLQIEDGSATGTGEVDGLPIVARTSIDTVARVPHNLSLLIGGYTRNVQEQGKSHVPGVSRIPLIGRAFRQRNASVDHMVRVFLIQPRVLSAGDALESHEATSRFGAEVGVPMDEAYRRLRMSTEPQANPDSGATPHG
ncbi:type III secretion system outer membrane ring subunit SctC [Dyella sp. Tek66A03]|uniref:type III secretion system outer membrane ring subunit SctC n=1 Tax=Dyella sp. Tek66A03 TaxID=3458298 RepID=UPI00403ED14E